MEIPEAPKAARKQRKFSAMSSGSKLKLMADPRRLPTEIPVSIVAGRYASSDTYRHGAKAMYMCGALLVQAALVPFIYGDSLDLPSHWTIP